MQDPGAYGLNHQMMGGLPIQFSPLPNQDQHEQQQLKCPRCDSTNTKFCYYNNYNLSQPRHFCKSCRRYWTKGGALRNIPVGGASRKSTKRSAASSKRPKPEPAPITSLMGSSSGQQFGDGPGSNGSGNGVAQNPTLEAHGGGVGGSSSESYLGVGVSGGGLQNSEGTSCWSENNSSNNNGWSADLAIHTTPHSRFQ